MQSYSEEHVRSVARERLESIVSKGRDSAGPVIQRVLSQMPEDRVMHTSSAAIAIADDGTIVMNGSRLHNNARSQLVERLGVPAGYANDLAAPFTPEERRSEAGGAWRRDLLRYVLSEHASHANARYLLRSQGGQIKAVLSDRFRRLDSRPLLESFVGACNDIGAVPTEGIASDLRCSVRAIVPQVFEPIPGEHMVFGLSWTNSDFGVGSYAVSAFALRLVCLNGMVGETAMKQVHLGNRLPDDLEFSAATYRKDTETMALATRDIVRGVLGERAINTRVEAIQSAASKEVDGKVMFAKVGKLLNKGELASVKNAFEGQDTLMLPAGKTAWRFSNALSWVANSVEDPERRLELQAAAGAIVA